ncbi:hypothetical protein AOA62_28720, partial [Pseudomonas sp. 2995-3]
HFFYFSSNKTGFIMLIIRFIIINFFPILIFSPKLLWLSIRIVFDDLICRLKYFLRRAIVLF